jgi:hypothetical protein
MHDWYDYTFIVCSFSTFTTVHDKQICIAVGKIFLKKGGGDAE